MNKRKIKEAIKTILGLMFMYGTSIYILIDIIETKL